MDIRKTYIGTLNGINGIWCGFCPENAIITEEKLVLYPKDGYLLKNKITEEVVPVVLLLSSSQMNDWEEIINIEELIHDNNN